MKSVLDKYLLQEMVLNIEKQVLSSLAISIS